MRHRLRALISVLGPAVLIGSLASAPPAAGAEAFAYVGSTEFRTVNYPFVSVNIGPRTYSTGARDVSLVSWNRRTGQRWEVPFACPAGYHYPNLDLSALGSKGGPHGAEFRSRDGQHIYTTFTVESLDYEDDPEAVRGDPRDQDQHVCREAVEQRRQARARGDERGRYYIWVLESADAGRSWELLPLPPWGDAMDRIVEGEQDLEFVATDEGVAYGKPSAGYSEWNRDTKTWGPFDHAGEKFGYAREETGEFVDAVGPLPRGGRPQTQRRTGDDERWTWVRVGRGGRSRDYVQTSRGNDLLHREQVRLRLKLPVDSWERTQRTCALPARLTPRPEHLLASESGRVIWGITSPAAWARCDGRTVPVRVAQRVIVSRNGGRSFRVVRPRGSVPDHVVAVDGAKPVFAFGGGRCGQRRMLMRRYAGGRYRSLGCQNVGRWEENSDRSSD